MKRIITIQDISCVGRCSITVALPIISAAGVETAVLPTAVLSTHTAFPKFTFRDLTDEIQPISDTFRELGIGFDAIYTGYLGSPEQIRLVENFLARFRTQENLVVIDPAMADEGVLYKGFTQQFADRMAVLCSHADLILPNLTEASYMKKPVFASSVTKAFENVFRRKQEVTEPERQPEFHFDGRRVLVCEDNEINAEIARNILEMKGMEVEQAGNGAEAIEQFLSRPDSYYDAILMRRAGGTRLTAAAWRTGSCARRKACPIRAAGICSRCADRMGRMPRRSCARGARRSRISTASIRTEGSGRRRCDLF